MRLLALQLVVVMLLAVVNGVLVAYNWYWLVPAIDTIPHFLGGLWLGLLSVWVAREYGYSDSTSRRRIQLVILVICLGIAWELFELLIGVTVNIRAQMVDTLFDLVHDALGVGLALIITRTDFFK
jgi:hypothetical protein